MGRLKINFSRLQGIIWDKSPHRRPHDLRTRKVSKKWTHFDLFSCWLKLYHSNPIFGVKSIFDSPRSRRVKQKPLIDMLVIDYKDFKGKLVKYAILGKNSYKTFKTFEIRILKYQNHHKTHNNSPLGTKTTQNYSIAKYKGRNGIFFILALFCQKLEISIFGRLCLLV